MTQEEKRIKLCEFAGWKGIVASHMIGYAPWRVPYESRVKNTPVEDLEMIPLDPLPNYFTDLNAVHELEKLLTDNQHNDFRDRLWNDVYDLGSEDTLGRDFFSATAAQRAEALGRTLSLWTE
jgi:hypothetical protein